MKLRNVFLLIIISTFLFIIIIASSVIVYSINTSMESQIRNYLYSSSRARAENIKTFLNGQKDTAKIVSKKSIYIDYLNNTGQVSNNSLIDRQMTDIKKSDEYIIEVFIINSQGKIVKSTDKTQIGADKSTDPYFTNGRKDIYIKDTYYSTFISKLNYVVAAPIVDPITNKTLGVSVIRYNPETYYKLVDNENGMGKTEENFLVNHDKYFISPSIFLGESVILTKKVDTVNVNNCFSKLEVDYVNKNGYSGLKQYLNGEIIVEAKDYRNVDVIATHDYITETGWCLVTKVDKSEFMAPIYQLIVTTLIVIAGAIII
ncbi:MAG: cache domain-containing protein, partial [Candidatus Saccharibacteria bacterium]